ncbi:hypothetical protein ACH5RR_027857 [Cinchona calisaya]|uniref:DUF4408 domain-containing protein n=1 Tax=Cinchona calisaya TaxID=153742 RepID=A0ABD2YNH0_9GENT
MDKFKKSQILKLFLMAILLSITPLLSTSFRPPYLYFVVNLLIIALGAEAGLLSFIFKASSEDKKNSTPSGTSTQKPLITTPPSVDSHNHEKSANLDQSERPIIKKKPKAAVEKSSSEQINVKVGIKVHNSKKIVKKNPSTPSLFFIGVGDQTHEAEKLSTEDEYDETVGDEINGQELFHKAETFIGNFYKQLKMQREDSWKKIHGLYHKAF